MPILTLEPEGHSALVEEIRLGFNHFHREKQREIAAATSPDTATSVPMTQAVLTHDHRKWAVRNLLWGAVTVLCSYLRRNRVEPYQCTRFRLGRRRIVHSFYSILQFVAQ
jgi:hypothetical protein